MTLPTYLALTLDTVTFRVYHPRTGNGACVGGADAGGEGRASAPRGPDRASAGVTNQLGERADPGGYQPARAASVFSVEDVPSAEDATRLSACLG